MSIKLICPEPWQGRDVSEHDSGFGDRITFWILSYHLSLIVEDVQIIVEEQYWPELLLIDLPNTTPKDISSLTIKKDQVLPINFEQLKHIILTKDFSLLSHSEDTYYYFSFSIRRVSEFYDIFDKNNVTYNSIMHNAISKVRLKLPNVSNFMQQEFSDCCCIHLRRGSKTFPTLKFLSELEQFLSKESLDSYWKTFHRNMLGSSRYSSEYKYYDSLVEKDTDIGEKYLPTKKMIKDFDWVNNYKITPDSDYFNLIDNIILTSNPNQKIYISSDIPEKYYSYYFDKYSDNIMDKTFYFREFLSLHKDQLPLEKLKKKYSISIFRTFQNVFDFMVGCYSEIMIKSSSNWSKVSSLYRKKKIIHADKVVSMNSFGNWTFVDYGIDFENESPYNGEDS